MLVFSGFVEIFDKGIKGRHVGLNEQLNSRVDPRCHAVRLVKKHKKIDQVKTRREGVMSHPGGMPGTSLLPGGLHKVQNDILAVTPNSRERPITEKS